MESSQATMAQPPAAMPPAPASSSRSRDPRLFGNFDLPAGWGCRRPMAFCKDHGVLVPESNAAAATEPQPNSSRSPPKGALPAAPAVEEGAAAQDAPRKQWNLRDRKAGRDFAEDAGQHKKLWNMDAGGRKSRGFSVELTRQEIEADFLAITGRPPPRRPKKHPKSVQRQIDTLCPGSSLSEVSRDRYKVNEKGGF